MAAFSWGLKSIEVQGPWPGVSRKDSREGYPSSSLRTNIQHITTLQFRVSSHSTVSFPLCRSSSWEFSLTNLCTQGSSLLHWTKQHLQAGQKAGQQKRPEKWKTFFDATRKFHIPAFKFLGGNKWLSPLEIIEVSLCEEIISRSDKKERWQFVPQPYPHPHCGPSLHGFSKLWPPHSLNIWKVPEAKISFILSRIYYMQLWVLWGSLLFPEFMPRRCEVCICHTDLHCMSHLPYSPIAALESNQLSLTLYCCRLSAHITITPHQSTAVSLLHLIRGHSILSHHHPVTSSQGVKGVQPKFIHLTFIIVLLLWWLCFDKLLISYYLFINRLIYKLSSTVVSRMERTSQ